MPGNTGTGGSVGTDTPFGRSRPDLPPGNDSPAGLPRPPSAPPDPTPGQPALGTGGGQSRTVPPIGPGAPPNPVPPAGPAGQPRTDPAGEAAAAAPPVEAAPAPGQTSARAATPARAGHRPTAGGADRFLRPIEPRPARLEIGPSVVFESRSMKGGAARGPSYDDAFAPSFSARARLRWWLYVGLRYRAVVHSLDLPPNSFGLEGQAFDETRRVFARSLDAYVHPTIWPTDWLHVWATVGVGWGQFTMPSIVVTNPPGGSTLRPRRGVFGDTPIGAGAAFDLPIRWLNVSLEGLYEPVFYQKGSMYGTTRYLDRSGNFATAGPMPEVRHSLVAIFGLAIKI